jgi:nucleoside phosphorylase
MKLLIVDDSDKKADEVVALFRSSLAGARVERAKSFRSALQRLESEAYDLLVLDMVLPIRDGESPSNDGGRKILSEIEDGASCRPPSHIICLTEFPEVADQFRTEASKKLVHVVVYSETSSTWRDSLGAKARQIQKRIQEADSFPSDYKIDVAIVTSSPKVELKEVLKISGFVGEFHQRDCLHYFSSSWTTVEGGILSVVACAAPVMGMTAASITATKVIERWRPRYLVMTGIAAGAKKNEQDYGDILVAEAAYDYGSGKITETEDEKRFFTPSYSQIRIDASLQALLQRWERDQLQTDAIRRAWHRSLSSSPRIILGLLASGAAVVQSNELVDDILEKSRKVVGLDMEAYGVFHAAHLATSPAPKVLVVKSVSDFADTRKSDDWQQYAAFTSAHFVHQFFTYETGLKLPVQARS